YHRCPTANVLSIPEPFQQTCKFVVAFGCIGQPDGIIKIKYYFLPENFSDDPFENRRSDRCCFPVNKYNIVTGHAEQVANAPEKAPGNSGQLAKPMPGLIQNKKCTRIKE